MIRHYVDDRATWLAIVDWSPPEFERVMICGWQPRHGNVSGYWWYEEAVFDNNGKRIDNEGGSAPSHWCPIYLPKFPPKPEWAV